jgi:glutaminyl-peptide cyclotransferase
MDPLRKSFLFSILSASLLLSGLTGCKAKSDEAHASTAAAPFMSKATAAQPQIPDDALPAEKTGGFDGARAFNHVAKQVGFGPHPSGSEAIQQVQDYLQSELTSYGCTFDIDAFSSDTPAGRLAMKNILVKIPGEKPGILLLGTHYDTKRLDNFVGADDGGSSTAVMLELARLLCSQHNKYAVWIAFFDGEEAVNREWHDPDNRYGSREMAARLATSGDLPKVRAFLLADIVGGHNIRYERETNSTPALTDLVWSTAAKLGYSAIFVNDAGAVEDDHLSFLKRNVPSVDIIGLNSAASYWHTPQDTLDKISAKSLAITGHVFLESIKQLQAK